MLIIVFKSNFTKLFGSLGTNSFAPLVFLTRCEVCEKTFVTNLHLAEHVTKKHTVVSEFLTWEISQDTIFGPSPPLDYVQ